MVWDPLTLWRQPELSYTSAHRGFRMLCRGKKKPPPRSECFYALGRLEGFSALIMPFRGIKKSLPVILPKPEITFFFLPLEGILNPAEAVGRCVQPLQASERPSEVTRAALQSPSEGSGWTRSGSMQAQWTCIESDPEVENPQVSRHNLYIFSLMWSVAACFMH